MNSLTPAALGVSIAVNLSAAAMNAATSMHAALHVAAVLLAGAASVDNGVITDTEQMGRVVAAATMARFIAAGASGHRAGAHYDGWSAGSLRGCSAGVCSLTLSATRQQMIDGSLLAVHD